MSALRGKASRLFAVLRANVWLPRTERSRRLVFLLILLPGAARPLFADNQPVPLAATASNRLSACVKQALDTLQPISKLRDKKDVNCDKADLPKCETKSSSATLSVNAAPDSMIISASTSFTKPGFSRDVSVTAPTITAKAATATVSCLGWGCEPDKGSSPGAGFLDAQQQRIASEDQISWAVYVCTQQVLK
jgi:hypothetical protein